MSKFLNRILGLKVRLQNELFQYFADTLNHIITHAKQTGKYDQGILDVGLTEEDKLELVKTHVFTKQHSTSKAKIEIHVLSVERGLSWQGAENKWAELLSSDEGFYISNLVRNGKKTIILAILNSERNKNGRKTFVIYRPNTGQQVKHETIFELKKKYKKISKEEARESWIHHFNAAAVHCSHYYWYDLNKLIMLYVVHISMLVLISGEDIAKMQLLASNARSG